MVGLAIVLGLFLLAVFGPVWAPKNPYIAGQHIVPHFDFEKQEHVRPPLPPSKEYPLGTDRWGNDLLSLMMHGARNTLVACAFITMIRMIVGMVLGAIAGWNEGGAIDRAIMGLIVVMTAVPMLISSMILIYALDIRRGLPVFIFALSVLGWAEIAQYTRSEFMVLRKMPYIEGARATGLSGFAIAVRHVLPNVLPQMLVIAFLQMGAVMLLLGELSFVGVFIGGGSRITVFADSFTLDRVAARGVPDVPEWGAILAEGFRLLRWRPLVVIPPAVAFFVAVLGFNALGEGLRRLVDQAGLSTGFLLRKRMVAVVAGLTLATVFVMNNTGPAPWFTRVATSFDGQRAYGHVRALASMQGRGGGQEGGLQASSYIAERFEAYGLEPGWKRDSYIYPLEVRLVQPLAQPYLAVMNADGQSRQAFRHQLDFGFVIDGHGGSGHATAPLTFVGFEHEPEAYDWESYKGLDLQGRIVLLKEGNAPRDFATEALIRGARGALWVAGDGAHDVRSQVQLADPSGEYLADPAMPIFRIRPSVADAILGTRGISVSNLLAESADSAQARGTGGPNGSAKLAQSGLGWFTKEIDATVQMVLALSEPELVEIPCVLGYKIGSDFDLAEQLIVLFAGYDGLGTDPDGTVFPGANDNASSIGLLLELAEVWHEQQLDARRSVLFVAWGGGQLEESGARDFLADSRSYPLLSTRSLYRDFAPAVVVAPVGVGAGGDLLLIHPESDERLSDLLREASAEVGIDVGSNSAFQLAGTPGRALSNTEDIVPSRRTRWLQFSWSDAYCAPDLDGIERIEPDRLQTIGEALSLVLTRMARQSSY
jgi:peptide/nickel transport system permease protein